MPFYTFETIKTGEEFTLEMSLSEHETYVNEHPEVRQILTNMSLISGTGGMKLDNDFKNLLNRIKNKNSGSTIQTGNLGEV